MKQEVHEAAHTAETDNRTGPGAILAQGRMARTMDVREVASRLRMTVEQVQALEQDDFARLGAPVFIKGYLVRYARLLGLAEDDLLARYRRVAGQLEPPPLKVVRSVRPQTRSTDWRLLSYPVLLFGVAWLGWWGYQQASDYLDGGGGFDAALFADRSGDVAVPDTVPEPVVVPAPAGAGADAPVVAGLPSSGSTPARTPSAPGGGDAAAARAPDSGAPPAPPLIATVVSVPEAGGVQETETASPGPAAAEARSSAEDAGTLIAAARPGDALSGTGGTTELVLSVSEDCWVEVRDSTGERLAYGVLRAQTVNSLYGVPPFSITLGNAQAVEMTVGGRPVAEDIFRPARGSVSRFVLNPASLW